MTSIYGYACASAVWLVLFSLPALGEQSGRELLDRARVSMASVPALKRIDTSQVSNALIVGQERSEQEPQTTVTQIEIDMSRLLTRYTATVQEKKLVVLKQGERAAMKLGSGPWEIPSGPYESMVKNMNLFHCEIETPETKENAPVWKLAGTELLDGHETLVIETEGNTGIPIAQARMTKGIAKVFSGDPAQQPTIKVLEYSSKHWISKSDYRDLQTVQISKVLMTLTLPEGKPQMIESSTRVTSKYSYEKVTIEIPEEAQKVLASGDLPAQKSLLKPSPKWPTDLSHVPGRCGGVHAGITTARRLRRVSLNLDAERFQELHILIADLAFPIAGERGDRAMSLPLGRFSLR